VLRAARLIGLLLSILAIAGLAVAMGKGHRARPHPKLFAKGVLKISNSLDGRAILTAPNLAPGQGASGQVTIENDGDLRGRFRLAQRIASERAGVGRGLLSQRLQLTIAQVGGTTIYAGPLAGLATTGLGRIAPRAERTYSFHVLLPEGGDDNAYQGAALTADYRWTATGPGKRCLRRHRGARAKSKRCGRHRRR
jgi:hypothetical protein